MGDDFRMVAVCPSCSAFGFIWPPPPPRGPSHEQHKLTETCRTCAGYGDVLTGSRRSGNELIRCGDCKGYGYTPNPVTNPAAFSDIPAAPMQPVAGGSPPPAASGEPVTPTSEDPRVAALRAEGFIVMPPVQQPAPTH